MNLKNKILLLGLLSFFYSCQKQEPEPEPYTELAEQIESSLRHNLLGTWYPKAMDTEYGGFFSNFTHDFQIKDSQDKMIVTQARHLWSNAKAAKLYPESEQFVNGTAHGFRFLKEKMWDKENGGFFQMVDRAGDPILERDSLKTAYGNSFGIYALAAYFDAIGDSAGLELAIQAFEWLEQHSYDPVHGGYFQHLMQDGGVVSRTADTPSTSDLGYKDQNSSIHLLEAFSELYMVWKDPVLKQRLEEMLLLVRDTITDEKGNLILFFEPDWTPVSFRETDRETVLEHKNLDHVSFGHDVETAYLMLEASHLLGYDNDSVTLFQAKKMVDQALDFGWDDLKGGFYDEGYYFEGDQDITIIKETKNWWAQAEGMNALLLMAVLFPEDERDYFGKFEMLWQYSRQYLIDEVYGDWYAGGLDKQPELINADKGNIWKGNYHQFRAMANCVDMLKSKGAVE